MDSSFPDVVLRPGGGRRCRVLYSYSPQKDDELLLQVNDEIDFLAEVEDGWWKGKLGNKIGVFPSNFVCEINAEESCTSEDVSAPLSSSDSSTILDDAPVLPPKPIKETCRVMFAYDAANEDELTLKKNDVITIITKEVEDKGWWKGELRGKIGLFPNNFVELIAPPDDLTFVLQKKPDRPSKPFEKIESKIPLTTISGFPKILQDNTNQKDTEEKVAGLKNEGPFGQKSLQNSDKNKPESAESKYGNKNMNLYVLKPEAGLTHKKTLDAKVSDNQPPGVATKKPAIPPPLTNKPKPASAKPNQLKRLSEEMNELVDNVAPKLSGLNSKRLSGDSIDGGVGSRMSCGGQLSGGGSKEDLDLDAIERTDMLTHITSSRPRPPGRRLPTKDGKETELHCPLTNGSAESCDKEKSQKEREWEKHKPPWVNELKLNLKSNKNSAEGKKSGLSGPVKSPANSPVEGSAPIVASAESNVTARQPPPQSISPRVQSMYEVGSRISELSSKFASVDKSKAPSPPKSADVSWNSVGDHSNEDMFIVPKKEFFDLKWKVDKLEKLVLELAGQLHEESDKRKLLEKELNKLTDLVTQV